MSTPLATYDTFEPEAVAIQREPSKILLLKPSTGNAMDQVVPAAVSAAIGGFKYITNTRDHKLYDIVLLGILSILIHNSVIDHFKGVSLEQKFVEPVVQPKKVEITLSRPQPKPVAPPPPPQVQPKPPVQKAVPLKPPKIKPKPVERVVEQTPSPAPVVDAAPTANAGPSTSTVAAPPAPVVEEKITEPTANAGYLHNPTAEYPEYAMERGIEGRVVMKVHVLPDGTTDSVTVLKSSGHQVLDDAAVKTVYKWSFVPAKRGETPIARYTTVPLVFKLS